MNTVHIRDATILDIEDELEQRHQKKSDLCRYLKISTQTYNNWRRRGVPANRASDVARFFGWPVERILGIGDEYSTGPGVREEIAAYFNDDQAMNAVIYILNNQMANIYDDLGKADQAKVVMSLFDLMKDTALRNSVKDIQKSTILKFLQIDSE